METTVETAPTSGKSWRAGKAYTLPSGNTAILRRLSAMQMVSDPNAPDFFRGIVLDNIQVKIGETKKPVVSKDTLPAMTEALNVMLKQIFVYPKIVDGPPGDDEVNLVDIDDQDRTAILSWLMGGEGLSAMQFPSRPLGGVGSVSNGDGLRSEALVPVATPG